MLLILLLLLLLINLFIFPINSQYYNSHNNKNNSIIKIFTIQKNTADDLRIWSNYHGNIFGYTSIHIIDHHSSDIKTLTILNELSKLGVTIHIMDDSFDKKHLYLTNIMNQFKNVSDILIPIDIDEYIAIKDGKENKIKLYDNKDMIINEINNLPHDGRTYKFINSISKPLDCINKKIKNISQSVCSSKSFYITPWWNIIYSDTTKFWKTFYEAKSFLSTDQGNHFGSTTRCPKYSNVKEPECRYITNLVLLHYHVKSCSHYIQKMSTRSEAYGFTNETNCEKVPAGMHYCLRYKDILLTKDSNQCYQYHQISCNMDSPIINFDAIYKKYC